jgi:DNA polymerase I-like protein with 3'-5' exonuclease and polymerase domains
MARNLKIEESIAADFQRVYFKAFPGLREYHHWVAREIGINQELTTPLGRRRIFFGRPGDDSTLREAIAYIPQSTVGDILNCALWRIWRYCPDIQLLAQVHDSICFQAKEAVVPNSIQEAKKLAAIPIEFKGKKLTIPVDAKVGWNWADDVIKTSRGKVKNPDGLRKWKGSHDGRRRSTGLDQLVS